MTFRLAAKEGFSVFLLLLLASSPSSAAPSYATGSFSNFATAGVSGIGAVFTFQRDLILLDRTDGDNTNINLLSGKPAYGQLISFDRTVFRPLDVLSNVFCSSGQIAPDGTFYSIGGTTNDPAVKLMDGAADVRRFKPCIVGAKTDCGFVDAGNMTSKRWYPTSQLLPDGRIFVVGGGDVVGNLAINNYMVNNPSYEFWPRPEGQGNFTLPILADPENIPYVLYPFVHLLPSGRLFIFAGQLSCVLDYTANKVVKTLPRMQAPGEEDVYRSYPVTGSSALLPLDPAQQYTATVLICGGNSKDANILTLNGDNCPGCWMKASASCGSINPDEDGAQWTWEYMPNVRVMPDAVLLLDGTVLWINGAQLGFQGLDQRFATQPVTTPDLYNPSLPVGSRFTAIPVDSGVPRMYHSEALLLPDGSVLLSGSNPNEKLTHQGLFPTQFQVQQYFPHYAQWNAPRNILSYVPHSFNMASTFKVSFFTTVKTPAGMKDLWRYRVVLAHPGFSTHSQRHGMRNVILAVTDVEVIGQPGTAALAGVLNSTAAAAAQKAKLVAAAAVRAKMAATTAVKAKMAATTAVKAKMAATTAVKAKMAATVASGPIRDPAAANAIPKAAQAAIKEQPAAAIPKPTAPKAVAPQHKAAGKVTPAVANKAGGVKKAAGHHPNQGKHPNHGRHPKHPATVTVKVPAAKGGKAGGAKVPQNEQVRLPAGTALVRLTVEAPPNGNLAPAGWYWLQVLDQAAVQEGMWVPAKDGRAVQLLR